MGMKVEPSSKMVYPDLVFAPKKLGNSTSNLIERFWVSVALGMPVLSKGLVFILSKTYMSVYYNDHSGLFEGLPGYEGRTS